MSMKEIIKQDEVDYNIDLARKSLLKFLLRTEALGLASEKINAFSLNE